MSLLEAGQAASSRDHNSLADSTFQHQTVILWNILPRLTMSEKSDARAVQGDSVPSAPLEPARGKSNDVPRSKGLLHALSLHSLSLNQIALGTIAFVLSLHIGSLVLFSRGFLLSRTTLEKRNSCEPAQADDCTLPPKFDRAIILLVDALRFDFLLPIDPSSAKYDAAHHNHLTVPIELTDREPQHSLLFKSIADPPTTTLQRLKAITTGSLPTFVDAGSNFAGSRVEEDNWLEQANRAGKRIAFMGDDTWLTIFPESIFAPNLSFPFDSFNVEDLDTVDHGVRTNILPLLDQNRREARWDILIGHPLGLDHAGHRFGASHPETTRKLKEVNHLLQNIVDKLDTRDLLIVMGDHGMDHKGDHGGDSPEETDAGLWLYSKTPLTPGQVLGLRTFSTSDDTLEELLLHAPEDGEAAEFFALDGQKRRSVPQISLVPSLSLLLGLPIPFNNLGTVIPELFLEAAPTSFLGKASSSSQRLLQALKINAHQIKSYLSEYASHSSGSDLAPFVPQLLQLYALAENADSEAQAFHAYRDFTYSTLKHTRAIWARFDSILMGLGLLVLTGSLVVLVHLYRLSRLPGSLWRAGPVRQALARGVTGLLSGGLLATTFVAAATIAGYQLPYVSGSNVIIATASFTGEAACLSTFSWKALGSNRSSWSLSAWMSTIILLLHFLSFASNSFTMWEDAVVLYLIQLAPILLLLRSLQAPESRLRRRIALFALSFLAINRLINISTVCREEQHPYCTATFYGSSGTSIASPSTMIAAAITALALPFVVGRFLDISKSRQGWSSFFLNFTFRSMLLGGVLYWAADYMEHQGDPQLADLCVTFKVVMARVLLMCSILLSTTFWYASPLCIDVQQRTTTDQTGSPVTQVTVIGFANSVGSTYLLVFLALFGGIFLLAQPVGQIVLAAGVIGLLCLLEATDSARDADNLRTVIEAAGPEAIPDSSAINAVTGLAAPSFLSVTTLVLLGFLLFFATGHQAVLSSIQWKTAFVGFPKLTYPFSPLLVVTNTLGPFILSAAALPLLVFWNVTPSLKNGPTIPLLSNLVNASLAFILYHTAVTLSTALFASHLRRHLMVWKVFAPRFMLSAITLLAVDVTILVFSIGWGGLGTLRKLHKTFGTAWL